MKFNSVYIPLFFLTLLFFFGGCASAPPPDDRYLTKEEDAQLRQNCEPHGGCVAVPLPMMQQIMKALRGQKSA